MGQRRHPAQARDPSAVAERGRDIDPGKRTRTGRLARSTHDVRAAVPQAPKDAALNAIGRARSALHDLRDQYLPDAEVARSARDFEWSRNVAASTKSTFARAEAEAKDARVIAARVDDDKAHAELVAEIDALDVDLGTLRVEVDEALRLAPADPVSLPFEAAWEPDVFASWEEAEARQEQSWNAALDADEDARRVNAAPTPLRDDECAVAGPHSPIALTGVQLYLTSKDEIDGLATASRDYRSVGPGIAGPYRLYGQTDEDQLVYYLAYHAERRQNEWVVGPDSVDAFAAAAEMYAGTAARLLPGSAYVEGSQADGADSVRDPDSVIEQEAFGRAPWQVPADVADEGLDHTNGGGGALVFARNARLRITEYVQPARELAEQLAADVAAGRLHHLDARAQAVDGRNALLETTRRKQSPAARYASVTLKEEGKTLADMTAKKVKDNLRSYDVSAETRALLDADSALWGKYATAMAAGDETMKAALRDLGQSPAVSNAIIHSAGKTNRSFTRLARWGGPVGLAIGSLGAADMVFDIRDAVEGENWHAAAGELAGFAGGVVGGELGAMGAVWIASAIIPGVGTGVVIVASIIGGMVGSALGSYGATSMVDLLADGGAYGAGLATAFSAAGGFAGLHSKDNPSGHSAANQLADAIYATDGELDRIGKAIPQARGREELQTMQRVRLDLLARRQQMEDLLTAIRLGALDGPQECAPPPPPDPEPDIDVCSIDDDCDTEFD